MKKSIFDGAIALDRKRADGKRGESVRVLEEMEGRIREELLADIKEQLSAEIETRVRAEVQEEIRGLRAASSAAEGKTVADERGRLEAEARLSAEQTRSAGLQREVERLNASLDRERSRRETLTLPAKTSVTQMPPAPVAYDMQVQRGSDGLIKNVQVVPKGH